MKQPIVGACLGVVLLVGCASKLTAKGDPDDADASMDDADASMVDAATGEIVSGKFITTREPDAPNVTVVDATVQGEWQRFDLDSGESTDEGAGWDLAFNRYFVISNGGVSGDAGVELALLDEQAFDDVTSVPNEGFATDQEDSEDDSNTEADNTFNGAEVSWYNYNIMTHELTPRNATYVVRSSEGAHFKLRVDDYYDDAGTPAYLRFTWAPLD